MKTRDYLPSSKFKSSLSNRYINLFNPSSKSHNLFSDYLDDGSESLVLPIIRRHEALSITHRELLQRLGRMEVEVEQGQRQLQNMKEEHSINKLVRCANADVRCSMSLKLYCSFEWLNYAFVCVADDQ